MSTDTAVCYTALYNSLYHTVFLVWVRQAVVGCGWLQDFYKDFCHMQ